MMKNSKVLIGYIHDMWYGYGVKEAVETDISTSRNSHTLICGMSGSGKFSVKRGSILSANKHYKR